MKKIVKNIVYQACEYIAKKIFFKKPVSLGRRGEEDAALFLKKKGYAIIAKNYFNKRGYRSGEIDIVARHGGEIVFVEVKSRMRVGRDDLPPEMAITKKKMKHLERCAYRYLREKKQLKSKYRFDAVGIVYEKNGGMTIRHTQNVFV